MGVNETADIDRAGLEFITRWEGVILRVYRDVAGYKTVGVGHLVTPAEDRLYPDGKTITMEHALELLQADVQACVKALRQHIVRPPLNQNQVNALVSFAFNCGTGVLQNSGVARAVNAGMLDQVRPALLQWCKVKINGKLQPNQGLLNRRRSEADLFERPATAPTPFSASELAYVQHQLDRNAASSVSYAVLACVDEADEPVS